MTGTPASPIRCLVTDPLAEDGLRILRNAGLFTVDVRPGLPEGELLSAIPSYDVLLVRSATQVTAKVLEAGTRLRVVGRAGIGVDNIDVPAATRRGVLVMNTPEGNVHSAAEHTWALLLSAARSVVKADRRLRDGRWEKAGLQGVEVHGKTLGVVGLGRVGSQVARIAKGFDMKVLAYDPFLVEERARALGVVAADLETIFRESDFITLHVPLNDRTRNLISDGEFKKMKKNARLVNCSRGGVVDEKALEKALQEKQISAAALDVFEKEPPGASPLWALDNLTVTPHLGASTEEAQLKVSVDLAHQLVDYFGKGTARNAVNLVSVTDPGLAPYVELAGLLGSFAAQILPGRLAKIETAACGAASGADLRPLSVAAIRGVLAPVCGPEVNLVNAEVLAADRGITVRETREPQCRDYKSQVRVTVESDRGTRRLSGTVLENGEIRFTGLDGFRVDVHPARTMLVLYYPDRPGMVGKFGTILGNHNINIARMEVGRSAPRQQAALLLTLDDDVPGPVVDELRAAAQGGDVHPVHLDVPRE